jgi:hypothetical protein
MGIFYARLILGDTLLPIYLFTIYIILSLTWENLSTICLNFISTYSRNSISYWYLTNYLYCLSIGLSFVPFNIGFTGDALDDTKVYKVCLMLSISLATFLSSWVHDRTSVFPPIDLISSVRDVNYFRVGTFLS